MDYKTQERKLIDFHNAYKTLANLENPDIENLLFVYNEFFNRLPVKIGDTVKLIYTPEITDTKNWGWLGAKHFIKKGTKGIVKGVDFNRWNMKVQYSIELYNQTWIDQKGKKHKVDKPYIYFFNEESVVKVK